MTANNLEKSITVQTKIESKAISPVGPMPVFVLFTSVVPTLKALPKAYDLATSLRTNIEILAVQTVPRQLPLGEPPARFESIAGSFEQLAARFPLKTTISNYLCRDYMEALNRVLRRDCWIVMGIKKSWWPNRDERLARKLCHAGYEVILVETE